MRFFLAQFLIPALLLPATLFADSWAPPTVRIFSSENGKHLFYAAPMAMKSFPELPEDKEANDKERKALGLTEESWGSLFTKEEEKYIGFSNNSFRPVWQQKLVNEIAPMSAFVSDDGKYVVTTDDYGRLGDGENVVVIYDSEGKLIKRFSLSAFLTAEEIKHAPQSVSSIDWSGNHKIDTKEQLLLLQVWQSGGIFEQKPSVFKTVKIRLSDGEILDQPKK